MKKEQLIQVLEQISKHYFDKKDYISAGQINLAIDVVQDYEADVIVTEEGDKQLKNKTK